jgi:hypothetical protein
MAGNFHPALAQSSLTWLQSENAKGSGSCVCRYCSVLQSHSVWTGTQLLSLTYHVGPRTAVFWNMTPRDSSRKIQRFGGTYRLHHQCNGLEFFPARSDDVTHDGSSGIWRRVGLVRRIGVSEEHIASIIKVTRLEFFPARNENVPHDGSSGIRRRVALVRRIDVSEEYIAPSSG